MIRHLLLDFFGDDWEDTFDSLKSAPGAFGNILLGVARQVRIYDAVALGLVVAGWMYIFFGYPGEEESARTVLLLGLLPTIVWLLAGIIGGLIFEIGGIGFRSLGYWESYLLMVLFAACGLISLRLALNPRDRRVYRGTTPSGEV